MSVENKHIQSGFTTITPYLYAKADLGDFLKKAFGGAHVLFGNGYFSDPSMAAAIFIYVPDVDATYKRAVSLGAKAVREPADMTWGDRVAGVKDTSGNTWWIATNKK